MQDLSHHAADSVAPTSEASGNMMSSNSQAMTAPGGRPVNPLPNRTEQGDPRIDMTDHARTVIYSEGAPSPSPWTRADGSPWREAPTWPRPAADRLADGSRRDIFRVGRARPMPSSGRSTCRAADRPGRGDRDGPDRAHPRVARPPHGGWAARGAPVRCPVGAGRVVGRRPGQRMPLSRATWPSTRRACRKRKRSAPAARRRREDCWSG